MKSPSESKKLIPSGETLGGRLVFAAAVALLALPGCANFKTLGKNLRFMETTYMVTVDLDNTKGMENIRGFVMEWDDRKGKVLSADQMPINSVGLFAFILKDPRNQYVGAYNDSNGNDYYDRGEPAWVLSDGAGNPKPLDYGRGETSLRFNAELSSSVTFPERMIEGARQFVGESSREEVFSGLNIPVALGDLVTENDLNSPRFSAERGQAGLWEPVDFPLSSSIGVFFLEKYDPNRTPVLFVYGAAGSPQDWRTFFDKIDRAKYQPWFYYYPTGRRLREMGLTLNQAITALHEYYGFDDLDVVAHSMGGLVARSFISQNVIEDGNDYVKKFVTISTPWGGHEAASMGVKHAPEVVPSWRDMMAGSDFQTDLYSEDFSDEVPHLVLYGTKSSKSMILPEENDGTVSVASQTYEPAITSALRAEAFESDHVEILSNPKVIATVEKFLAQE